MSKKNKKDKKITLPTVTIDSDYPSEVVIEHLRNLKTPTNLIRLTKSLFK